MDRELNRFAITTAREWLVKTGDVMLGTIGQRFGGLGVSMEVVPLDQSLAARLVQG